MSVASEMLGQTIEAAREIAKKADERIAELEKERDEWVAHCEALARACNLLNGIKTLQSPRHVSAYEEAVHLARQTPAASLAEHDANVIEDAIEHNQCTLPVGSGEGGPDAICFVEDLKNSANTLRQQAKDKG